MKKRIHTSVLLLCAAMSAWAGHVGEQQARQKAAEFMSGKATTRSGSTLTRVYLPLQTKSAAWSVTEAPIYIYNLEGGGYVIVSGDDRTAAILGYSDRGSINADRLPENMKSWLQGYVDDIERIPASATPQRKATTRSGAKTDIATKLKTTWGQDTPYNLHTPNLAFKWKEKDTVLHSATGCIATAMSMIMHYYRYPSKVLTAIPSYEGKSDVPVKDQETGERSTVKDVAWKTEAIAADSPIDWTHITDKYSKESTDAEKEAVSRLMQYCGSAVNMQYGVESEAKISNMLKAFKNVFGYHDVYVLNDFEYKGNAQGWVDAVYDEMSKAGPVLFGGKTPSGSGHQFILDGYQMKDGKDYFYVNWGWNGEDNGYMLLNVLDPGWTVDDDGNHEGYSVEQDILCGLGPEGKGYTKLPNVYYVKFCEIGDGESQYSRSSKTSDFKIDMFLFRYMNVHFASQTLQAGIGVYDGANKLVTKKLLTKKEGDELLYSEYLQFESDGTDPSLVLLMGAGLDDGTYTVKLICAEPNSDVWTPMQDADAMALKMTVSGDKCSFSPGTTAIRNITAETPAVIDNAWYSLSGVRFDSKPTAKGVYIHQGRKEVVN